jgi:hypothetical protein
MVKAILKKVLQKKIFHAAHVIFEFMIKIKKAMGTSAHSIKTTAVKAKAAAEGVTANPLTNPVVHMATKSVASAGTAITSSTATAAVVTAVVVTGGVAVYEYQTNPDFSNLTSESVKPLTNLINEPQAPLEKLLESPATTTTSVQNETTTQMTGLTTNTIIGVGNGDTGTGSSLLSVGLGTVIPPSSQNPKVTTTRTVPQDNPNDHSAIAPSIDFEIPG